MAQDKRQGWLKNLEVGGVVAVRSRSGFRRDLEVYRIKKITPSGRIITLDSNNHEQTFDHDGEEMGPVAGNGWSLRERLIEMTPEIVTQIKRQRLEARAYRKLEMAREEIKKISDDDLTNLDSLLGAIIDKI